MKAVSGEKADKSFEILDVEGSSKKTRGQRIFKQVQRKFPILKWLPTYRLNYIPLDIIAGFTVWLTAIPACMGDAAVAGLTPEFGLYSGYVGAFLYLLLGSCKELIVGPQAVLSLVSFQSCGVNHPECVILLAFYSGVVHMVLGILHLGFLVSFISEPVTVGFTAGAAIMIASGQLKFFCGISGASQGTNLIKIWQLIIQDIETIRLWDTVLGVTSAALLILLFKLKDIQRLRRWHKYLHILSLCRNALILLLSLLLGFALHEEDRTQMPFIITGPVPEGFPDFNFPHFTMIHPDDLSQNRNITDSGALDELRMSFGDTLKFFGSAPLVVAFIALLQNVAISKKFADGSTKTDATQELISLGAVNLIGAGFFDAIPCSASFSRSAVNASSGVKSHFAGGIAGALMVLSLAFLTPYFQYIPKSSLAAIIIAAIIFMIDFATIIRLWKFSKLDLLSCLLTFLASVLLGMEYGILIGVGFSVLVNLLKSLQPSMKTEYRHDVTSKVDYVFIRMDQGLSFPSVDHIRDQVLKKSRAELGSTTFSIIVLECSMWTKWDYTTINAVVNLVEVASKSEKVIVFYRLPPPWLDLLSMYGLESPVICQDMDELISVFMELSQIVVLPPKKALPGERLDFPEESVLSSTSNGGEVRRPSARISISSSNNNHNIVRK